MKQTRPIVAVALTVISLAPLALAGLAPAGADPVPRRLHRHHEVMQAARPQPTPYSFYPEDIEGGVHGNLPFNNQLRKLKDPLNANGAGR